MYRKILIPVALITLLGCSETTPPNGNGNGNGTTPPASTGSVTIGDNFYSPGTVNLAVNGTVTWTWAGSQPHTVSFDNPEIASTNQRTSGTTSRLFAAAGEYTYYCEVHGRAMSGKVVVQ